MVALNLCIKRGLFSFSGTAREFRVYYNDGLKSQRERMSLEIYKHTFDAGAVSPPHSGGAFLEPKPLRTEVSAQTPFPVNVIS